MELARPLNVMPTPNYMRAAAFPKSPRQTACGMIGGRAFSYVVNHAGECA
jgi:hypothetical protein